MTPVDLRGRVALVTGASRGIGRAVALALAAAGVRLALTARTTAALDAVAAACATGRGEAAAFPCDVTDDTQVERLIAAVVERFAGLDILVNNAGGGSTRRPAAEARLADWDATLRLNLRAAMVVTRQALPHLLARGGGAIVNIASIAGRAGSAGAAAYSAAKFGVIGFTESLFEEVREHGIKVAAICPGFVDTALIPPNRRLDRTKMLQPEDVAAAVLFVVGAASTCCPTEIILRPQCTPYL